MNNTPRWCGKGVIGALLCPHRKGWAKCTALYYCYYLEPSKHNEPKQKQFNLW